MPVTFEEKEEDQVSLLTGQDKVDTAWANPNHITTRQASIRQVLFFLLGCLVTGLTTVAINQSRKPSAVNETSHNHAQASGAADMPPHSPHPDHNEHHQWTHCGSSPEEAVSRGCTWNGMMVAWMPPACDYPDLNDQYVDYLATRKWYADPLMRDPVPNSVFDSGNFTFLFAHSYHKLHCLYIWRRLGVALQKKWRWVDDSLGDFHHPEHCVGQLAPFIMTTEGDGEGEARIMLNETFAVVQYPRCVVAPWLK